MNCKSTDNLEVTRPSCVIHWDGCDESLFDNLLSPRDLLSWCTLKDAAERRNFQPLLSISDGHTDADSVPPGVYYHRKCRQHFTLRVPPVVCETETLSKLDSSRCNQRRDLNDNTTRVLPATCIFCKKVKYVPKTSNRENLVQCREMRAESRIRKYAQITQDKHLLGLTGCYELVAAEAKYHPSCYQKCKRVTDEHAEQFEAGAAALLDDSAESNDSASKAFRFVVDHIDKTVFSANHVVPLTEISTLYVSKLLEYGHSPSDSTKRNLRRKLEQTFQDRLHFCQGK